jgi:hypothetical protein
VNGHKDLRPLSIEAGDSAKAIVSAKLTISRNLSGRRASLLNASAGYIAFKVGVL